MNIEEKGFSSDKYVRVGKEIFGEFFDNPEYSKKSMELFCVVKI